MAAARSPRLHSTPRGRRVAEAVALAAVGSLLVACGSEPVVATVDAPSGSAGGSAGGSSVTALSKAQAKAALLTLDNLPDGWVTSAVDESDDKTVGCLQGLDDLEERDAASDAEAEFAVEGKLGLPSLSSLIASYKSERSITQAMSAFRRVFRQCRHVDETGPDDGVRVVLDFKTNDDKSSAVIDDQVNLTATGTVSKAISVPFGLWISVSRVENHMTVVAISDVHQDLESMLAPYTEIAADRLLAVVGGREPAPTLGPGLSGTAS